MMLILMKESVLLLEKGTNRGKFILMQEQKYIWKIILKVGGITTMHYLFL